MAILGIHDMAIDDVDAVRQWSVSGCRWLTDSTIGVPGSLVRRVLGLVHRLDERGAGLRSIVSGDGLGLLAERAAFMGLASAGGVSAGGATRMVETTDGWIAVSLARPDDHGLLPAWLEASVPADDPWGAVYHHAAERTSAELVGRASLLGLACSATGEVDDARPAIAHRLGDSRKLATHEALVLNLASLWAGPLCGDVLARLGARLVTVESAGRPDGGRMARPFFDALHGRSESVALDFHDHADRGALRELLKCADVVIEGSRPRALQQLGIDAAELISDGPQVWISITSHGRDESNLNRVGFGDDAAAAGGLVGWTRGVPKFVADAVADPLTGLTAAVAAIELLERGGRWLVDVALARCAAAARDGWIPDDAEHIEPPKPRSDPGAPMPLGRDTNAVLRELIGATR